MKNNPLRELARSFEWQCLYTNVKNNINIKLFLNKEDLSRIQILFLEYLEFYYNLYIDLYTEEALISQEVIDNDLWADSYILWKRKNRDKLNNNKENRDKNFTGIPKITFTKKKK